MTRQSGLGRGLSALLPAAAPGQSGLVWLPLEQLVPNPRQPRADFDDSKLAELAHSLREVGMLQPIVVRPVRPNAYEIVAGERRYRAARIAGLAEVPAVVRHTGDDQLLTEALVENIHRADLNPIEEAAAYQQLLEDFGITHEALAAKLGKSRSAITNALRLLALEDVILERVAAGVLSAGHARALLGLEGDQRDRAAQRIVAEGLSVRETEELVRRMASPPDDGQEALSHLAGKAKGRHASPFAAVERLLADALSTRVVVKGTPRRGRVLIDYAGPDDLQRLLDVIARGAGIDLDAG